MKDFPFSTSFSSAINCIVSKDKDELLALASLAEVAKFIPNIDTDRNVDLLPVSFNACVVNRINKNKDVVDTKTALAFYKYFANKPINAEHDRKKVIGVILNAGFSEFRTDKVLTEEQVSKMTDPFNITLGGVIWRIVGPEISDLIEDSNDPTSENYQIISASWELGFAEYDIALLDGNKKNLSQASEIITDPDKIELVKKHLTALKGDGKYKDMFAYRMPKGEVLPLGIGFTEKPAAEVKGIATESSLIKNQPKESPTINIVQKDAFDGKNTDNSKNKLVNSTTPATANTDFVSHSDISAVNTNIISNMKITSLDQLTDDNLKEAKATDVAALLSNGIAEANKTWLAEKSALINKLADIQSTSQTATTQASTLQAEIINLKSSIASLEKDKTERDNIEKFNGRMATFAESYELDDNTRAVIAEDIKSIASDEDFTKYSKKMSILLASSVKKPKDDLDKSTQKGFNGFKPSTTDDIDNQNEDKNKAKNGKLAPKQTQADEEDMASKKAKSGKKDAKDTDDQDDDKAPPFTKKAKASEEAIASTIEEVIDNATIEKGGLPNGQTGNEPSLKEKYAKAFSKENFVIKV